MHHTTMTITVRPASFPRWKWSSEIRHLYMKEGVVIHVVDDDDSVTTLVGKDSAPATWEWRRYDGELIDHQDHMDSASPMGQVLLELFPALVWAEIPKEVEA